MTFASRIQYPISAVEEASGPAELADIMERFLKLPLVEGVALDIKESELVIKALRLYAETEQNDHLN